MPPIRVVIFCDAQGSVPLLDWLDRVPDKARAKCVAKIERLSEMGHELRRPEADFLRDGIYELRTRLGSVNYRMLYFFAGNTAVVLSHGLTKEDVLPPAEIDRAVRHKSLYLRDPRLHTSAEAI